MYAGMALTGSVAMLSQCAMTKLEQIEKSVSTLSDEELKAFAEWFAELQWQRWDRRLEADVKAGKLDKFAEEALTDFHAGRTRPL
jgi:hypothetical protein